MSPNRAFTIKSIKIGENHENMAPRSITNTQLIAVEFVLKECSPISKTIKETFVALFSKEIR